MTFREHKTGLRQAMRNRLRELGQAYRLEASARARSLLQQQALWRNAAAILFYAPLGEEPDLWPLLPEALASGKAIFLPRYNSETDNYTACRVVEPGLDIVPGKFGIREAAPHCSTLALNRLDVVLVPGLAFDRNGRRLGRGKGFYDRLLSSVCGFKCGVGFDEQVVPEVPVEPHDILLNCILTPTRWFEV